MTSTKGCIYYTDNRPKSFILDKCREEILKGWKGPLVSVSLQPIDFGKNIVLAGVERGLPTMIKQITMALEALDTDIVFFLEHDVLYHPSHFDFTPPKEEIYYYNLNNWRWGIKENFAITYDGLTSLSQLACYRKTALNHYKGRLKYIIDHGLNKDQSRDPRWGRVMGYEPGTKPRRRGGFSDEKFEIWKSDFPNIDIRHRHTFSPPKYNLADFKHQPINFRQEKIENIPYWNLKTLRDQWLDKYIIN
ncbi:MAG: hypothetical protein UV71_C0009G0015 [Microgenomates group bacterium GW2011_GWC1_43_13]|uniref:Glycosyltransferase n=3 Tax=Candidatus Woeseibacteriota TaxID=1752722 RepID=A0A837IDK4_9BACT|nr:MAG: hypothetical protein UV71_C0009G0015 [Microgenomates group bacterium GW2011_GWC1_43_13]KKT32922.1 MAG: hypothetical protein UW20_C0007G0014 [Candidatus Woesebacteria bacterium GW2011_GWB1_44_11]KKT54507.1 MAG: hypothetical protein UW47_C0005G0055 [Candidatus Woesebacteria bacterium GW2011_GWA1_44_23]OGM75814.1 MAG: hypothetical protein A2208_02020 [Candidatus Woesebacteria bacterium RIFOXYA1_FULL_43_16]OGM81366.1 MAG: hypothetical protein A2394_00220 [Candidatus Woesebacteria bacterium 